MTAQDFLCKAPPRRGGCAINKVDPFRKGRGRGGRFGEIFRPETSRRTDHPVCGSSVASRLLIDAAATPPRRGGECAPTELCLLVKNYLVGLLALSTAGSSNYNLDCG